MFWRSVRVAPSVATALVCLHSAPLSAQRSIQPEPPDADAVFPAVFSGVHGIRELSDGRLLVADNREKTLRIVDWATRRAVPVGRVGDGPGEYRGLSQLVALGGDSTILIDGGARRWQILERDRFVSTVPIASVLGLSRFNSEVLGAVWNQTVLLYAARPSKGDPQRALYTQLPQHAESLLLVLAHLNRERVDTVAALRGRPWGLTHVLRDGTRFALQNPLQVAEQALQFTDGWIAIVRRDPYRVDWRRPDGSMVRGRAVAETAVAASVPERRFAAARVWPDMPPPRPRLDEFPEWPRLVPPFTEDALFALPGGQIAVERMPTSVEPGARYDVFSRGGELIARILLPDGERLALFGHSGLYTLVEDGDGVLRLVRRAVPHF